MDHSRLDKILRDKLGNYEAPYDPSHWEMMSQKIDESGMEDPTNSMDEEIKEMLEGYEAASNPAGWSMMSSLLDEMDQIENENFDQEVKDPLMEYEAPYESKTWPVLEEKIIEEEQIRQRLYVMKALELVSVLLVLFTLYNFYPELKTKILEPGRDFAIEKIKNTKAEQQDLDVVAEFVPGTGSNVIDEEIALNSKNGGDPQYVVNISEAGEQIVVSEESGDVQVSTSLQIEGNKGQELFLSPSQSENDVDIAGSENTASGTVPNTTREVKSIAPASFLHNSNLEEPKDGRSADSKIPLGAFENLNMLSREDDIVNSISSPLMAIETPKPYRALRLGEFSSPPTPATKTSLRFGIHTTADINILYIPEDNFYSDGNRISFEAQDIPALGYGGGFTLSWDGPVWGFETGVFYSSKSFKPGRQLLIGEPLLNSKVDFQSMRFDLVSIPMSSKFHVKKKGKFRLYFVGGIDFNLIAQAHYDLLIQNNYPRSLSITQDPGFFNSNREAHRVKEHILDGAEFNSKSFFTGHAGFGIERFVSHDMSVFMQPLYTYQIPLGFIGNGNSKQLTSINIQVGARLPLR